MTDVHQHFDALTALLSDARASNQRRLVVLSGERQWGSSLIRAFYQHQHLTNGLWIGDGLACCEVISNKQVRQVLGKQYDVLIYDAHEGFDPNAIATVTGTLAGGGLLFLMVPQLESWPNRIDPEYQKLAVYPYQLHQLSQRFIQLIRDSLLHARSALIIADDGSCKMTEATVEAVRVRGVSTPPIPCYTQDQCDAVEAIVKVCTGHRRRPLVITADRGRGKSSALGIASAKLMSSAERSLLVTAPLRSCVDALFERTASLLNLKSSAGNVLQYQQSSLRFIPPDQLLAHSVSAELLMVDEAAAIPAALLEQLLRRYSRIVFATTVHGYEGTGRGFAIRFNRSLDAITPQWKSLELSEPVRWAQADPVERWLFDALLLDTQRYTPADSNVVDPQQCVVRIVERDQLVNNCQLLGELFSLMVNAHYQTTPSDLRNLLDGPNICVWISCCRGQVVAAALTALEGGFDRRLSEAVYEGRRRPSGHLLPQSLAAHSGWQQATQLSYVRIIRIAVTPSCQRLGLGGQLVQAIIDHARNNGIDMVGSSFAASADVVAFWRCQQLITARVGLSKDSCSGVPSLLMLAAVSAPGRQLLMGIHQRFVEQFTFGLSSIYKELTAQLVVELLLASATHYNRIALMDQQDWLDINAFAKGHRQPQMCQLALFKLVSLGLGDDDCVASLTEGQIQLLVYYSLQQHSAGIVCQRLQLTGKKQLVKLLRQAVATVATVFRDE